MKYLLDTNIFIEAYSKYYQPTIVPSFWEFLKNDADIFTITEVITEIKKGGDDLHPLIKDIKVLNYNVSDYRKVSTYTSGLEVTKLP